MRQYRTLSFSLIICLLAQLFVAAGAPSAAANGPIIVSSSPADNDVNFPENAKLTLTFDEAIKKGTLGSIAIKKSSTNEAVMSVPITDSRITIGPSNTLVITPASNTLEAGMSYYVEISANAILNNAGVGFAGINNATTWDFSVITADNTAPTAVLTPASGGTMLATDTLQLTFNEKVFAATGNIRIVRTETNDTQVISVLSTAVRGSGEINGANQTVITITPPTRLVSGSTYQIVVESGAFVDVVGNAYVPTAWTITTKDSAILKPVLTPQENSASVPLTTFTAQMNFAVDMVKGTTGLIQLKRMSDNVTVSSLNMTSTSDASRVTITSGKNVSIAFNTTLTANTGYYILIDPGVLKDTSGIVYEGFVDALSWKFTTATTVDSTPPTVTSLSPANGSSITALNGSLVMKFSEPVRPGSGTIVIRYADASRGIFCSIPVTSSSVVGGGTNTLTITPSDAGCGNFVQNKAYAVQIGTEAIIDLAGNRYAGITDSDYTTWRFQISADNIPPELMSTIPASGYTAVKTTDTFTMVFSEDVIVNAGKEAVLEPVNGGTRVTALLKRNSADARKVEFTAVGLTAAKSYVIRIPNDAITDLALNPFPGILNDYRWKIQTVGSDTVAPLLTSASMDGNTIVLMYNEPLDELAVPYPGNYYVTVNDVPRQVNVVQVKDSTVRLTLQSGVAVGQVVKVSYTPDTDTSRQVKDVSGNRAVLLSSKEVTNTSDTTLPRPLSGVFTGSVLTLTFNKQLQTVSNTTLSQFYIKLNGYAYTPSSITISGATVMFTLNSVPTTVDSVSISYSPSTVPLRDLTGNGPVAFTDFYIQNSNDITPPQLASAVVLGTSLKLTFNEGISPTLLPLKSNFSVISGGVAQTINSVTVTNNVVELTLSKSLAGSASVYISYIPGTTAIYDLSGNKALAFNNYQVTVASTATATLLNATASGNQITLTYNGLLNTATIPYTTQYYTKVNNNFVSVIYVSVQGTQVIISLATPVTTGQTVTLSYNATGVALKDALNQQVAAFADRAVTNGSTISGITLPDYLVSDSNGGLKFVTASSATKEYVSSSSGRTVYRYAVDGTKLTSAYETIRTGSTAIKNPILTFDVPSTEALAMVSIPISSLMDASSRVSNASFRVKYGDLEYTIPLTAVNYSKELYLAGGTSTSATVLITIEKTQNASLSSVVNIQSAQFLTTPVDFKVSIVVGTKEKEVTEFDMYVKRTFVLPSFSGKASEVAVVRYDTDSGALSFVPTKIETSNNTATVNFFRKSNSVYAIIRKQTTFTDTTKHWANSSITMLANKFIVSGPTRSTFQPTKNITRAEFAEFIARGLGLNGDKTTAARFLDVGSSHASAAYIGAVSKAGIVEGGTDGNFRPNASITREEMATMFVRAMNYAGVTTSASTSALNVFKDKSKISSWASNGVAISVSAGLIKGTTATTISPKSNATRAEAAVMLERFLKYVNFL
ncbi:MAG: Ig-like domain-containing protein [Candidatus Cohnella colombiensis]|uniref:Ig-like domain-containing protein n=1 Tax=Candidatus Cohnella colombiensis TaxID=3121368 RepID=A0AA95F371_9BACL|nr:MAG: Ig-like domain-containing protein [Cohnella sp.]